jgi:isochorismate synthase
MDPRHADAVGEQLAAVLWSRRRGEPRLLSATLPVHLNPDWFLATAGTAALPELEFLFYHPARPLAIAGFGVTTSVRGYGPNRFLAIREGLCKVAEECHWTSHERPLWVGGFAFVTGERRGLWLEWPDAELRLPRWIFEWRGGDSGTVTVTVHAAECADESALAGRLASEWRQRFVGDARRRVVLASRTSREDVCVNDGGEAARADWRQAVASTAADIRAGAYEKVVLARQLTVRGAQIALVDVLQRLADGYPDAYLFVYRNGRDLFVGASPERLVKVNRGQVHIDCLAGTIGRGRSHAEDEALARQLLNSAKDLREHQAVVDWVSTAVADVLTDVQRPETPGLRRLANVQHLYTPVTGRLAGERTVLDLVERLHPTPAVAGVPRAAALDVIAARETEDRGWYAGPIGWLTPDGDGEFAVALRCGLLNEDAATLFAGAGIMGASSPDSEWRETQLKLQPMLRALGVSE